MSIFFLKQFPRAQTADTEEEQDAEDEEEAVASATAVRRPKRSRRASDDSQLLEKVIITLFNNLSTFYGFKFNIQVTKKT